MAKRTTQKLRIVDHPVVANLLTQARHRDTPPPRFREVVAQIGLLLAYEATRDLRVRKERTETPMETMDGVALRDAVTIVPILRAGMGLVEGISRLFPDAPIGHIGMFRDERALRPVSYYEKLPPSLGQGVTLLVDPMLATGGSAIAGLELLKQRGARDLRMICILAAPEGVRKINKVHPGVPIYTAALDRELDDRGYILPGLGDAGDRLFGTGA
jgi:uracil phosphoribosyltransferase